MWNNEVSKKKKRKFNVYETTIKLKVAYYSGTKIWRHHGKRNKKSHSATKHETLGMTEENGIKGSDSNVRHCKPMNDDNFHTKQNCITASLCHKQWCRDIK